MTVWDRLNPFNYTLAEVKAAALQLVTVAILLVGFFVLLDPGTEATWQAAVVAIFSVVGVFAQPNPDPTEARKSLMSLVASVVGLITLYGGGVADETLERIGLLVGALIPPLFVLITTNARTNRLQSGVSNTA